MSFPIQFACFVTAWRTICEYISQHCKAVNNVIVNCKRDGNITRLVNFFVDYKAMADYRAGFNQCANEVNRNILAKEANAPLREKLLNHLASCCHGNARSRVITSHPPGAPEMTPSFPASSPNAVWVPYPSPPPSPQNKSAVFVHANPAQSEIPTIHSSIGTPVAQVSRRSLSPVNSPSATTKAPLWRPW